MKAKQRTLGVLLFLILLAGGVFALLTLRNAREEQAASAAADGTIPLAAVSGNDLTQIVPNLVEAMFTNFPGNSGERVRITVAPPEKK